jgi:hypothetical protein
MAINFYRTLFHTELAGVVLQNSFRTENIAAANNDPATLAAVITSNGLTTIPAGANVVLDSVANASAGSYLT